jgi:hypothetical protein
MPSGVRNLPLPEQAIPVWLMARSTNRSSPISSRTPAEFAAHGGIRPSLCRGDGALSHFARPKMLEDVTCWQG